MLTSEREGGQVVGIVTALSDGVLNSFIPLLEVLPTDQVQGIGQALMTRILDRLASVPNVDLPCDADVIPFYERFGIQPVQGMA